MAADPHTGHLFVSDRNNARISEFTSWGAFVKAWGWDVAPGAVNEEQEVQIRAASGQFKLSFGAFTTPDLNSNATAAQVEAALNALPSIGSGGGSVNVTGGPGGPNGGTPYIVSFDGGPLAATDVAELVASNGTTPPSGGVPFTEVRVATRADGTAGGTGLEACTSASGCKAGASGSGAGQFISPKGIAIDAAGDIYVYESPIGGENHRVQKFDSAGRFVLMWGGEVNKTTGADICTKASGDTCGAGLIGTADGWFSSGSVGNYLTYNPATNTIFVGDKDRIQEFGLDGSFEGKIEFGGPFDGETVEALAADPSSGDLYLAFSATANVFRVDPATTVLDGVEDLVTELPVNAPRALAVDVEGRVYVVDEFKFSGEVLGFEADGSPTEGMQDGDGFGAPTQELFETPSMNGLATNVLGPGSEEPGDLYVDYFRFDLASYVNAYGPAPLFEDPPRVPPEIAEQFASSVETDAAVLKAKINPFFWTDTTYFVQYGTAACPAAGWEGPECSETSPALLSTKAINAPVTSAGVLVSGLLPATTYHYRFVAQSGGGGPVFGEERTFTTFESEVPPGHCPNDAFRTGPGARLPDCRAYELVSPLAKNNADVLANPGTDVPISLDQSAESGERLTYSAGIAFSEPEGAPFSSQYLAQRHERGTPKEGWASEAISPPRSRLVVTSLVPALDSEYRIFSADLCDAWLKTVYDPPLAAGAVSGYPNLYRRRNCGTAAGSFEALTTVAPPHLSPTDHQRLQPLGASADGNRSIFVARDNLPGTGAPNNENQRLQLYLHGAGAGTQFVCVLPSGVATSLPCYPGTADEDSGGASRRGSFEGAISAVGERVFWSEHQGGSPPVGPGRLYVRFVDEPKSRPVSQKVSGDPARFWGAAKDGSRAIFSFQKIGSPQDGRLYSFNVDTEAPTLIAAEVKGVMGMSDDAKRVYFASTKALSGEEPNSEGDKAKEGDLNLYLWQEGEGGPADYTFIARLRAGEVPSAISASPFERISRVSPDGLSAAFMSSASLTGYDNTDAVSGQPDAEVFLYDAAEAELRCVSCNPTGARPTGEKLPKLGQTESSIWYAAKIPVWWWPHYATRVLSDDGTRVFFESLEALVPRDANATQDVYQWEEAGTGSCEEADATFVEDSGGCVELISSGESPRDSVFLDASATGDDVFFSTLSSLVGKDYGLVDVYDARVEGGFPEPQPRGGCEGEACQSSPPPPAYSTPSSESFEGAGNTSPKPEARRCPKGKRRVKRAGRVRCVKRRKAAQRRAGR